MYFYNVFLPEEFEGRLWSCTWWEPYGCRDIRCFQWGIRMLKIKNFKSTLSQTSLGNIYYIWFQRNTRTLFVAELVSFVLGLGCLCLVRCGCWVWRSCILVHVLTKIFHSYKRKKRKRKRKQRRVSKKLTVGQWNQEDVGESQPRRWGTTLEDVAENYTYFSLKIRRINLEIRERHLSKIHSAYIYDISKQRHSRK